MEFTVLQWNINGFRNNYQNLQLLIKEMDPSFISLQETHCPHNFNPTPPKNYTGYFTNSPHINTSKQGAGIFIKSDIPHILLPVISRYQTIAIQINLNIKVTILSFYIPPDQEISIREICNIILSFNPPLLIIGDFNGWNTLWGSATNNSRGVLLENIIQQTGLCVLNNGNPTHFSSHNTFTNIDISLCSTNLLPTTTWATLNDLYGSDHFPIIITIRLSEETYKPIKINKFLFHLANWNEYSLKAETEICTRLSNFPDSSSNKSAAIITKAIRTAANAHIPQSKTNFRTNRPPAPWWNSTLATLRNQKMKSWQHFKANPTQSNLLVFKKHNATFRREMKTAKQASFEEFTKSINRSTTTSTIWNKINRITRRCTSSIIRAIDTPNETLTDPLKIANHFAKVWAEYASDSNFSPPYKSIKYSFNVIANSTRDKTALHLDDPITISELNSCLNKVKGKTPGFDRISYPMIKSLSHASKTKLLHLYNTIFQTGNIPHAWKLAIVAPIPKTTNSSSVSSYRPISLLPCLSKIIERIIATRLAWFLENKNLIAKEQVAFKANKGVDDALLHMDYYITKALSAKNHITILSIDFEKAFDRIGSHVVLGALRSWSIGPKMFNFVRSFLSNRRFKVKINGHLSNTVPMDNGIPQGSPLSVVLFQIAFNEISKIIKTNHYVDHCLYADDLYILCKKNGNSDSNEILQNILYNIKNWTELSGAKISLQKTKKFHICRKNNCDSNSHTINIDGTIIQTVTKLKILGLTFSKKYNWKDHLLQIKNPLISRVNIIRYLSTKSFVHINTLTYLTRTLVLSKIDYGLYLYGNSSKSNINIIKPIYHQAARSSVYAFRTTPMENILHEANLPSLTDRIYEAKARILTKLLYSTNSMLYNDISAILSAKRPKRIKSAIAMSLSLCYDLNIPLIRQKNHIKSPPWKANDSCFDLSLAKYNKHETPKTIFHNLISERNNHLKNNNWRFLYTDGTKSQNNIPAYAIVNDSGEILALGTLFEQSSVFTAEACAIYHAIRIILKDKLKTVIFSDSLSVITAIRSPFNNKWNIINKIRDALANYHSSIKVHWIPSHIGIAGNEDADSAAKYASYAPIILDNTLEKIDIRRHIASYVKLKFKQKHLTHPHYSNINPHHNKPIYPTITNKQQIRIFSRLRLGHTTFSHQWLLKNPPQHPICSQCNCNLSIKHVLTECTLYSTHRRKLFGNTSALDLLKEPSSTNIKKINNFIKLTKLII